MKNKYNVRVEYSSFESLVRLEKNKEHIMIKSDELVECLQNNEHLFTKLLEVYFENELAKNDQDAIKIMQLRKKFLGE